MSPMHCARQSHPSRGAWIEIIISGQHLDTVHGRTPHGVRGLKCIQSGRGDRDSGSHPSRGAWIEIISCAKNSSVGTSHPSRGAWIEIFRDGGLIRFVRRRTPHGVRGLKYRSAGCPCGLCGRTPHGVRGLKFGGTGLSDACQEVAPLTGCVD